MTPEMIIPVKDKPGGTVIGSARLDPKCEIVNIELDSSEHSANLRDLITTGFVDSLSIGPNFSPAGVPVNTKKKDNS